VRVELYVVKMLFPSPVTVIRVSHWFDQRGWRRFDRSVLPQGSRRPERALVA
jgi:hypothetical protein